jgi:hypothetical protein
VGLEAGRALTWPSRTRATGDHRGQRSGSPSPWVGADRLRDRRPTPQCRRHPSAQLPHLLRRQRPGAQPSAGATRPRRWLARPAAAAGRRPARRHRCPHHGPARLCATPTRSSAATATTPTTRHSFPTDTAGP